MLKQEMAQTGLFEKVKEKLFKKKTLIEVWENAETLTEKTDKEYKARTQ